MASITVTTQTDPTQTNEPQEPYSKTRRVSEETKLKIAKLLGANQWTHKQIARMSGVSRNIVHQVSKSISLHDDKTVDQYLEDYRAEHKNVMPISFKTETIRRIAARYENNPFAALKAVAYSDTLLGIIRQADNDARQPIPQALFALPAGSTIHIEAGRRVCDAAGPNTPSQIPDNVIDITPNSPDSTDST